MVGPHPTASLTPAQAQAQQQSQHQASERAKLRSRKPTDKNLPEGVEDCIIGDGVQRYRELRELERRLDATMMRKRLDIQESVNRNVKVGCNVLLYDSKLTESSDPGHCESGLAILWRTSHGKRMLWIQTHSTSTPTWTLLIV